MRTPLDSWDKFPEDMIAYLRHYGKHFSKKMYEFAVRGMYKVDARTKQKVYEQPLTLEQVESTLKKHNITLKNNVLYDAAYVMSMASADFLGSSLPNDLYVALFVKDYIDDPDQVDGFVFNRFYADCILKGEPINWSDML